MAAFQHFILYITMVTVFSFVHAVEIQRLLDKQFLQNAERSQSYSLKIKKRSVISNHLPSLLENGISYQDRSGERQRINTHDPIESSVQPLNDPNMYKLSESCKNSTYCEEVINYPEEAVLDLLATLGEGISLQIDRLDQQGFEERVSIDGNVELCQYQETIVYPRAANGYDNQIHLLVNGKDKATKRQGFRVQNCLQRDCQCKGIILAYQSGYRGRCKQYYNYRTATAFRMINGKAEQYQTLIRLPGYCGCIAEQCTGNCNDTE